MPPRNITVSEAKTSENSCISDRYGAYFVTNNNRQACCTSGYVFRSRNKEATMQSLVKLLVILSVAALAMAVIEAIIPGVHFIGEPESYSRLSNNLALIAIAIFFCCRDPNKSQD